MITKDGRAGREHNDEMGARSVQALDRGSARQWPNLCDCRASPRGTWLSVRTLAGMSGLGRRIGLLHHVGGGNLGDDATQDAVMQNIRDRWPDAVLIGLSMNPADTEKRHGIPSYAIRRQRWSFGYAGGTDELTVKGKLRNLLGKESSCPWAAPGDAPSVNKDATRAL